jgi:hypothetical protein
MLFVSNVTLKPAFVHSLTRILQVYEMPSAIQELENMHDALEKEIDESEQKEFETPDMAKLRCEGLIGEKVKVSAELSEALKNQASSKLEITYIVGYK